MNRPEKAARVTRAGHIQKMNKTPQWQIRLRATLARNFEKLNVSAERKAELLETEFQSVVAATEAGRPLNEPTPEPAVTPDDDAGPEPEQALAAIRRANIRKAQAASAWRRR